MIQAITQSIRRHRHASIGIRYESPGAVDVLTGVMADADIDALRERNAKRLEAAQRALGDRWLLARRVERKL